MRKVIAGTHLTYLALGILDGFQSVRGAHELYFFSLIFCFQLGILNIVENMELASELVYPLYLAACADWYILISLCINLLN